MKIFRDILNRYTTDGLRRASGNLWQEVRICRIHRSNIRRARRYYDQTDLRLHVGCGPRIRAGWVNIDLSSVNADLHLDLREPFPFREESVAMIESEHFLEHLSYPREVTAFLSECLRVMNRGGCFSVGVPDAEASLIAYAERDDELFRDVQRRYHPKYCTTPMHSLNYLFRQGEEHKYAWDYVTLSAVLAEVGFVDIKRRSWDESRDTPERRIRTLYIDARKS